MINKELFELIIRGRARRELSDIVRTKEDMIKAARNSNRRIRYPGYLDAPRREKQDYRNSKPFKYT